VACEKVIIPGIQCLLLLPLFSVHVPLENVQLVFSVVCIKNIVCLRCSGSEEQFRGIIVGKTKH
jgi:hypothetical protein